VGRDAGAPCAFSASTSVARQTGGTAPSTPTILPPPRPLPPVRPAPSPCGAQQPAKRVKVWARDVFRLRSPKVVRLEWRRWSIDVMITSMDQLETALRNGIEKVIKSVGLASSAPPAGKRSPINHCGAMANLPLKERLDFPFLNKKEMESVRFLYEAALKETMGGATLTRESYVDTMAAWDLMCSTAVSELKFSDKEAESYMLDARLLPTSDAMNVKPATVFS